ncbi:unnamed protein product [Penicillium camemberti]|uniref:Str. FM013 n=1 Tax=Penicillium camemberti (strain FM 013) TaxID=1429867 RepID=A0A0G4P572_PENC3|nr:unnamed protein product [Penicillium camemberti]
MLNRTSLRKSVSPRPSVEGLSMSVSAAEQGGLTLVPPVDEVNRSELTGNGAAGEADKPNAVFQGCLVDPSASIDEPQVLHQPVQDHISPAHYIAGPLYCGSLNN